MAVERTPPAPKPAVPEHQRSSQLARFVRGSILFLIWGFITYNTISHQRLGGGPEGAPTVDALCPFGGLSTLYHVCARGEYLQRVFPSSIVLLAGVVLMALVLRRAFCGWICPLGAMQELFGSLGRRLKWRWSLRRNRADASARYLKYAVLVVIIALTWLTGTLVFRPYDPWASYAHLSAGWAELRGEFLVGTIVLALTVLGSLVLERSWCRYLCPLGGLLGVLSKAGATRVVRHAETCVSCGRCDRACPVDIPVRSVAEVRSAECLTCGECVAVCPVPDTLSMRIGRRPVANLTVGVLAVVIFFGTVLGAKALGVWESRPQSLEQIVASGGQKDPANIRGFMTINEISRLFGIPASEILKAADLPADTPLDKPSKDLMKPLGRETEEVRDAVVKLLGSPPDAAAPAATKPPEPPPTARPAAESQASEAATEDIAGTDTLADLQRRYGVPPDQLLEALSLPADTPRDKPLRDILRPLGRHVTEVREAIERRAPAAPAAPAP